VKQRRFYLLPGKQGEVLWVGSLQEVSLKENEEVKGPKKKSLGEKEIIVVGTGRKKRSFSKLLRGNCNVN